MRLDPFSTSPGKRAVERAWLAYTPVWGAITGCVMLGGLAERWGDVALMTFGLVLALGTLVAPLAMVARGPAEHRRAGLRATAAMTSAIVVLAFGLNDFQTPFFFDVLHMRYGFHAQWVIDRNPVFLYLVTVPYFATYSVLACLGVRALRRFTPRVAPLAFVVMPLALAFLETVLNASPLMTRLFCYDDPSLMLGFGTLAYGVSFVLALPCWMVIEEAPWSARSVLIPAAMMLAVVAADTLVLAVLRTSVAPALTTIVDDAPGTMDGGCREMPRSE